MSRQARFEVVRTDDGWHGRFRAANGRVVWTTEIYTRQQTVWRAFYLLRFNNLGNALHAAHFLDERTP